METEELVYKLKYLLPDLKTYTKLLERTRGQLESSHFVTDIFRDSLLKAEEFFSERQFDTEEKIKQLFRDATTIDNVNT